VIAGRRNVHCLRMSTQAGRERCGNLQVGAGMPSVSGGYSAADTLSDDPIDAIRQRTCRGCVLVRSAFFGVIPFLSY